MSIAIEMRKLRFNRGFTAIKFLVSVFITILLAAIATFIFVEGRKQYWDHKVDEMCEKDGGIKIYETVKLSESDFNKWGQPDFYKPTRGERSLGNDYIYISKTKFYKKSNPRVARYHVLVFRRNDNKLLGESISYGRGGGDLPSISFGTSYHCPDKYGDVSLLTSIFKRK